jgi:type I restriction enzyme S subunit
MITNIQKYPTYKDSGAEWIGDIPINWDSIKMKHLFQDVSIKKKGDAELLSVTQDKGVVPRSWVENRMVMPSGALESFKFINKGDFAISLRSFEGGLEYCHHDGIISPAYTVLKAKRKFESQFYKYLFKSSSFISELQTSVVGIRQGKNISFEELSYSYLPIPTLAEQTAIADFLDRKTALIDQAIDIKQKQIELLKERRQILIHKAVTRGLNPKVKLKESGVEWIGDIPEGWEVKRLKMILRNENGALKPGPFGSDLKGGDFVETGYKVYNQRAVLDSDFDISEECINERKYKALKNFSVKTGDILLTSRGTIGKCSIVPLKYEDGIIHPCIIRLRLNNEIVTNNFIKQYIEWSVAFQASLKLNSNATTIDVIYGNTLSASLFIIPPIVEQCLISEYIETENIKFINAISLKEKEIEKLKEYKATLINSAVTGKIKVC